MGIRARWHAHRLTVLIALLAALGTACGGAREQPSRGRGKNQDQIDQLNEDTRELHRALASLRNKLDKIRDHQMFVDEHGSNFEVFFNPSNFRQIIRNLRVDFNGDEWHLLYAAELEVIKRHKKLFTHEGIGHPNPDEQDASFNNIGDDAEQAILNYDILLANKLTANALAGVNHLSKQKPGGRKVPGQGAMMYGTLHAMLLQLQAVADEIGFEHTLGATRTSIATLQSLEDNFKAAYGVDITASKAKQQKQLKQQRKDIKSGAGLRKGEGRK